MNKPKIAHITSVHGPFDSRILHKECITLVKAGFEVVLIVPHTQDELVDGVNIRAVPKPKGRWERMTRTVWNIFKTALKEEAQSYHFHDPEFIPWAILLKIKGKKVIYDVHEDLPKQIQQKEWISAWLRGIIGKGAGILEEVGSWFFDSIVAATPAIAKRFPSKKTVVVENYPILSEIIPGEVPYAQRENLIIYIGGLTKFQGIRQMVQAITLVPKSLGVRFVMAGLFENKEMEKEIREMPGWQLVEYLGWQPREGIVQLLKNARVGVVVDHPVPNYMIGFYSIKMFEYMLAGIPLVGPTIPVWKSFIEGAGSGIPVNPLDPKAIADAIVWLLTHPQEAQAMGESGRETMINRHNWDIAGEKLLSLYSNLISLKGVRGH